MQFIGIAALVVSLLVGGFAFMDSRYLRHDVGSLQTEVWGKDGKGGGLKSRVVRAEQNIVDIRGAIDDVERRLSGYARRNTARVGAMEDAHGIDHNRRLIQLSGFQTGSPELSPAMAKKLGDVVELVQRGWVVRIVVGFADSTPYLVNGVDKNPELSLMRARTTAARLAGELKTAVSSDGRGSTAKFGGLDVNRSVLIYLERGK